MGYILSEGMCFFHIHLQTYLSQISLGTTTSHCHNREVFTACFSRGKKEGKK